MRVSKWRWLPKTLFELAGLIEGTHAAVASAGEQTTAKSKGGDSDFLCQLRALQKPRPRDFVWMRDDARAR